MNKSLSDNITWLRKRIDERIYFWAHNDADDVNGKEPTRRELQGWSVQLDFILEQAKQQTEIMAKMRVDLEIAQKDSK